MRKKQYSSRVQIQHFTIHLPIDQLVIRTILSF